MDKKTRKRRLLILLGIILAFVGISLLFEIPVTEKIKIPNTTDPSVKCVLVTDLHSCSYGKDQKTLVSLIKKQEPDIIFLGGDIFDDKLDDENTKVFLKTIVNICPCFYVTGNHEQWSGRSDEMCQYTESVGITVLHGSCSSITVSGKKIDVCGVDDPSYLSYENWQKQLAKAWSETSEDAYKILLTHRPEKVDDYKQYDFDLVLAGHAHAGQIRIPFLNKGLYAPNQGFFAEYVSGLYELKPGEYLIVSRGLARESTPLPRFFNNPEIVVFEI